MRKIILLVVMAFVCQSAFAQTDTVAQDQQTKQEKDLKILFKKTKKLTSDVRTLTVENSKLQDVCDSLAQENKALSEVLQGSTNSTNEKFSKTDASINANNSALKSRTTWGIVLVVLLVCGFGCLAYYLIKRVKKGSSSIDDVRKAQETLTAAQTKMQEESIKLDNKLLEIAEKQIQVEQATTNAAEPSQEIDHSLVKKVADEIVRIKVNLSRMDSSIKGHKQLSKAVERMEDNFKANGYEIIDMLGQPYNEGMKVIANFIVDENLPEGQQIITGVTKPAITYNGKMIQAAEITVSQNI